MSASPTRIDIPKIENYSSSDFVSESNSEELDKIRADMNDRDNPNETRRVPIRLVSEKQTESEEHIPSPDEFRSELETELNGRRLDVRSEEESPFASEVEIKKEEPLDDSIATLRDKDLGNIQPTDTKIDLPLNVREKVDFEIPQDFLDEYEKMMDHGTRVGLKPLQGISSRAGLVAWVERHKDSKSITDLEYKKLNQILETIPDDETVETVETVEPEKPLEVEKEEKVESQPEVVSEKEEKYKVPQELMDYLNGIVSGGNKRARVIAWFIDTKQNEEQVVSFLEENRNNGVLTQEQYEKAMGIMGVSPKVVEEPKEEKIDTPETTETPNVIPELEQQSAEVVQAEVPQVVSENAEIAEKKLDEAREEYKNQYIEWYKKHHEKKRWYAKVISGLGMEKTMPEMELPVSLREAKDAYIEARKETAKARGLFEKKQVRMKPMVGSILKLQEIKEEVLKELADFRQEEDEKFEHGIEVAKSKFEKKILARAYDRWKKIPLIAKIPLSVAIGTAGSFVFGTGAAILGPSVYAGYRLKRTLATMPLGGAAAIPVTKFMDAIAKRKNEKLQESANEDYGTYLDEENFKRRELEASQFSEKMRNVKKMQRLAKAGAVFATGFGISAGVSALDPLPGVGGISKNALVENPKPSIPEAPLAPHVYEDVKPVEVSLSSKGFIADLHNLKQSLLEQYGGNKNNVPEYLRTNVLDRGDVELAKEFGFYDPEHGLSGKGLEGETLGIDDKGNIIYQHLDGSKDTIINTRTEVINKFQGDKFNPNDSLPDSETIPESSVAETAPNEGAVVEDGSLPNLDSKINTSADFPGEKISNLSSQEEVLYQNGKTAVIEKAGARTVIYEDSTISHEKDGMLVLDDKYQDGIKYKPLRSSFVDAMEKNSRGALFGENPIALDFEGGRVYIVRPDGNPNYVRILLNGREIANGFLKKIDGHPIKLVDEPGIKGSWFSADTVYERAFNLAKKSFKDLEIINTVQ